MARRNKSFSETWVVLTRAMVKASGSICERSHSTSVVLPAPTSPVTMMNPSPWARP